MYGRYILPFLNMFSEINENMTAWKERLKVDWVNTKYLPRKKKKQKRKEINLDWEIASYEPFQDMFTTTKKKPINCRNLIRK